MTVPSRHFFDLSTASRLSSALRQRGPLPGLTRRPPSAAVQREKPHHPGDSAGTILTPFQRGEYRYAEELWEALLEWIRRAFDARGVFALDKNGFAIGNIGDATAAPAEVLMASFTSVAQLLEAYLSEERPLAELMISAENEPFVSMIALPWHDDLILLGIHGGSIPSMDEVEVVRTTVRSELARFAAAQGEGQRVQES